MAGPLGAKRVRRCHLLGPGGFLMVMVVVVMVLVMMVMVIVMMVMVAAELN